MKIFISKITLALCGILFSFNCQSQYKYDFGVKLSTFRVDGIELEQRIHFKSGYTFSASFNRGGVSDGYSILGEISGDVIADQYDYTNRNSYYSGKLGITKELSFLPTDFFYTGISLGAGYEEFHHRETYLYSYFDENGLFIHYPSGLKSTSESTVRNTFDSGAFFQLGLSFGMDIPLTKRLLINCELNGSLLHSRISNSSPSGLRVVPSFSGGLRYAFGKL